MEPASQLRKVTSLTNSTSRAKDIWEVVAWMGILVWRETRIQPHPPEGVGPQELESLVAEDFSVSFIFEVMGTGEPAVFFFGGGRELNNKLFFVEFPEFWEDLAGWGLSPFSENCLIISLLFGAVIHMGELFDDRMTGISWSEMGSGNKEPKWIHQNYRVV